MDYSEENSYMRTSQLRPPSRIPSPGKGLAEISESQSNARSKPASKMPPPPSMKHKLGATYDEPEPKRKTLVERAGESRLIPAPITSRSSVKGTSLVGASRNTSFSSSVSSHGRTPSLSSRSTSNGSFSNSVGPGNRPKSAYGSRPQTSMAFAQSTTTRSNSKVVSRPATAMEIHDSDDDLASQGKRKGMLPLPSLASSFQPLQGNSNLQPRKVRAPKSTQTLRSQCSVSSLRDFSVSTALSMLRIDKELPNPWREHQANSPEKPPAGLSFSPATHKTSISTGLRNMRIDSADSALVLFQAPGDSLVAPKTPSQIPVLCKVEAVATPCRTPKISPQKTPYLTKDSNIPAFTAWDVRGRLEDMEAMYSELKDKFSGTNVERNGLEEAIALFKTRVAELELLRAQLSATNKCLQTDLDSVRQKSDVLQERLITATTTLDDQTRAHRLEIDDMRRDHREKMDLLRRTTSDEVERLLRIHREELREMERRSTTDLGERLQELERRKDSELEQERSRRLREVQDIESRISFEQQHMDAKLKEKDLEIQNMRGNIEDIRGELDREQTLKANAQRNLTEVKEIMHQNGSETSSTIAKLESTISSLSAKIHFLESGSKAQSDSYADMESRLQEALRSAEMSKRKLIKEETLRRILFNQVQELKGNIRVMCRVRPPPHSGSEGEIAAMTFPDVDKESKELEILGKEDKSSLGKVTRKPHAFTFDRVFGPESQNLEVFEEISQLVQSALDGYNVCIFCYGQTGSGKTHTMSSADGMIPRATHQIYETATNLREKGWTYIMEGSFIEVYNEEIHDLLGDSKDLDKKKHEIRHDEKKKQTVVTGLRTVILDSPNTVESMMKQAQANRSVAATKSNERSSRSHSVFILKLMGRNSTTGETSEGTLNLVDLAGSERLKQSGAEGDRMKETQNINKSLSCLGDVIGALGQGKEGVHIPYRNSKLTYLLQYSLGGNSKTLMFVMASPLEAHLSETLTSLKFATKVHNTHIGTAKKSKQIRSSE